MTYKACAFALLGLTSTFAGAAAIELEAEAKPSNLITALNSSVGDEERVTDVACYSVYSGLPLDCAYRMELLGLD